MHYHLLTLSPIESTIQVVLPSGEGNALGSQRLWVQIWYQVHMWRCVTCWQSMMWDTLWPAGISCETHCDLSTEHRVRHIVACRNIIMWDTLWPVNRASCETHCDLLEYHVRHIVTCRQSIMWDTLWPVGISSCETCCDLLAEHHARHVTCWQSIMWDVLWPVGRASCETCCDLLADPKQTLTAQWRSIHAQLQVEFILPQPIFDQDQYCSKQSSISLKGLFSHHLDWCLFCLSLSSLFKWQRLLLNYAACAKDFTCASKHFQTSCVTHKVQCNIAASKQDIERVRSFLHTMSILRYSEWNWTERGLTCQEIY